jgi:hypothetical protein
MIAFAVGDCATERVELVLAVEIKPYVSVRQAPTARATLGKL